MTSKNVETAVEKDGAYVRSNTVREWEWGPKNVAQRIMGCFRKGGSE